MQLCILNFHRLKYFLKFPELTPNQWLITSLLAKAEINSDNHQISYSYPLYCRMLFTDPMILERCLIQAPFMQKYSNLLYEMLSVAHFAKQKIVSIEIADLRSHLHLGSKLTNYSDLDRFVLTPAINEINSYASFVVKYQTKRKGMKVTHLIFNLTSKRQIAEISNVKIIIPPKRPRLFIDNPQTEIAYAYLLNAETKERRKYFDMAIKLARKKKIQIV